jgi:acetyl-CoA C-acetyltransferase
VCGSGLKAVMLAAQAIRCGDSELVVAGGMESMSGAPYLLPGVRWGQRLGNGQALDHMIHEGLTDAFYDIHMGITAENLVERYGITRAEQDAFAAESQQRALAAIRDGCFKDEIVAVPVPQNKGEPRLVDTDEHPRPGTTAESLAKLAPAFQKNGTITAGNASQLSDGAAAVAVMSSERAEELGIEPLAEIVASGMCAERFAYLHTVPAIALQNALEKAKLDVSDLGLLEINEAFASVAIHATRMLGVSEEIVNVNGNSVALGHALGSTGARMAVTLVHEMRRRGVEYGAATLCGGGGQGYALILRRPGARR